jgi:UDP-glucose 4-epimerase
VKNVLVTGGNGFIGGYVVERLRKFGYEASILDRHQWATHAEIPPPYTQQLFFGDIKDATLVDHAVSHVDGVIHLAGILGTQETVADPRPAAETNILGGLNVITACAKYDVPLVNIAVGNYWMQNTYSITKNSIERFIEMKRMFEDARMCSVRALNAYGPGQVPANPYGPSRVRKIMPSFICRALDGKPIEVYGSGDQVMDMIYVEDVANVLVSTLEFVSQSQDVNVPEVTVEAGTGRKTTVREIADMVADEVEEQSGKKVKVAYLPMRPGEPPDSVVLADPSTVRQVGVNPKEFLPLERGIANTVNHYVEYMRGA